MSDNDDIVKEFLAESHENLDRLDREVVELEKHPSDKEILASIFRTIHTIKGTSGFLGFGKLEAVTHVGESLLARLRDGQLSLNPERTTALLAMIDAVRQMLAEIQATGEDGNGDHGELVANLTRLQQPSAGGMPQGVAALGGRTGLHGAGDLIPAGTGLDSCARSREANGQHPGANESARRSRLADRRQSGSGVG